MSRTADTATIRQLLAQAGTDIGGDSARLDAEVLLAHVLDRPRSYLLAWPDEIPADTQSLAFRSLVDRRARGEPVAHLTGSREFWSLQLNVTPDTLIPRPETETLVAAALERLPTDRSLRIADLGTGCGAIALAIASERPHCHIIATDRSDSALETARLNAGQAGLDHIEFRQGDWCTALATETFDLVVSNPPYIASGDAHLLQGDVRFEPRMALAAGPTGMDDIERIADCVRAHLAGNGTLLLEHGFRQGMAVRALLASLGYRDITTLNDLAGLERVTAGTYN